MRSKAPLSLMEQMVMILVFALAAALCVQAFVKSDGISGQIEERDRAVTAAQSMAEAYKSSEGDPEEAAALLGGQAGSGGEWICLFDEDWNMTDDLGAAYAAVVPAPERAVPGLLTTRVSVWPVSGGAPQMEGEPIFSLPIACQGEVNGNG